MINLKRRFKDFGPLEALVLSSMTYVIVMLLWTASTRSEVMQKASDIKSNHKLVVDFINDNHKIPISIDTRSSKVAMAFENYNIQFINDVSSGFHDSNMLEAVSRLGCRFIMTHMPREHKEGKIKVFDNVVNEISEYFIERIESCNKAGIKTEKLIIDPGIGFGKSGEDNIKLLNNIHSLKKETLSIFISFISLAFLSSQALAAIKTKILLSINVFA